MEQTLETVIVIVGGPIALFILVSGIRFAWYVLSGQYWLDKRTGAI